MLAEASGRLSSSVHICAPFTDPTFSQFFCLAAADLQNKESVFGLGLCVAVVVCFVGMLFGLFPKVGFGVWAWVFGRGERELFAGLLLGGCVSFEGGCAGVLWFV